MGNHEIKINKHEMNNGHEFNIGYACSNGHCPGQGTHEHVDPKNERVNSHPATREFQQESFRNDASSKLAQCTRKLNLNKDSCRDHAI